MADLDGMDAARVHNKGLIADDAVLVSSVNWNENSVTENREAGIALEGAALADYFSSAFLWDWENGTGPGWGTGARTGAAGGTGGDGAALVMYAIAPAFVAGACLVARGNRRRKKPASDDEQAGEPSGSGKSRQDCYNQSRVTSVREPARP